MRPAATACMASALSGLAILISANAAAAANFAGTWAVSGTIGNPVIALATPNCTFKQDGDTISGACEGPGSKGTADGVVDGTTIVWHWHAVAKTKTGLSGEAVFTGVMGTDGSISGTWTHSAVTGMSGKFTAQRQVQSSPSPATSSAPGA
ncbi:MAG TPA: hypothetical protein VKT51_05510 [Candidatus Eremiobacteraceae bacterium]|nr:hypothetical protein [Candidatus Eremiobacteraceae bacterium]